MENALAKALRQNIIVMDPGNAMHVMVKVIMAQVCIRLLDITEIVMSVTIPENVNIVTETGNARNAMARDICKAKI